MVNDNIQLHFDYEETTLYSPDIQFLTKLGIKPSPIYDVYWKFAVKRQGIFQAPDNKTIAVCRKAFIACYTAK